MEQKNQTAEFFRAMDRIRRAWHSITPCESLSKSQFGTLMVIARGGKLYGPFPSVCEYRTVKPSVLAETMGQSLPALSQRIRILEQMGFIERVPDPDDRRINGVRLTEEGARILETAQKNFNGILSDAIVHFGPEKYQTLILLLSELAEALELTASNTKSGE